MGFETCFNTQYSNTPALHHSSWYVRQISPLWGDTKAGISDGPCLPRIAGDSLSFVPARHRLRLRRGGRDFVPLWQKFLVFVRLWQTFISFGKAFSCRHQDSKALNK
jgi:hypothetical protein